MHGQLNVKKLLLTFKSSIRIGRKIGMLKEEEEIQLYQQQMHI